MNTSLIKEKVEQEKEKLMRFQAFDEVKNE